MLYICQAKIFYITFNLTESLAKSNVQQVICSF